MKSINQWISVLSIFFKYLLQRLGRAWYGKKLYVERSIYGKVVIITGANSGLGIMAVKELVRRGATVILACRNQLEGKKAMNEIEIEIPGSSKQMACLKISWNLLTQIIIT